MTDAPFEYDNLPHRSTGTGMRLLSALLPGVRSTLATVGDHAAAWREHNTRAAAATGPLWVVLGDSMAQGIGATSFDRGWPGQLAARIDPSYRMVNLSSHGARVADAIDRQWPAAAQLGEIALVTVVVGANDIISRRLRGQLVAAFTALVDQLPTGAVVAGLPNPLREAREIDRMLRRAERDGRIVMADLRASGAINWRGKLAADHFHPNDAGYSAIADKLAAVVNGR